MIKLFVLAAILVSFLANVFLYLEIRDMREAMSQMVDNLDALLRHTDLIERYHGTMNQVLKNFKEKLTEIDNNTKPKS